MTALGMICLSPIMNFSLASSDGGETGFLEGLPSDTPTPTSLLLIGR